jgi:hypothetical protein
MSFVLPVYLSAFYFVGIPSTLRITIMIPCSPSTIVMRGVELYKIFLDDISRSREVNEHDVKQWREYEKTVAAAYRQGQLSNEHISAISSISHDVRDQASTRMGLERSSSDEIRNLQRDLERIILRDTDGESNVCLGRG